MDPFQSIWVKPDNTVLVAKRVLTNLPFMAGPFTWWTKCNYDIDFMKLSNLNV